MTRAPLPALAVILLHSQATVCAGGTVGRKGMMVTARAGFERAPNGRTHRSRIPAEAPPPLDYRDSS